MITLMDYMIGFHSAPALRGIKVANLVAVPRNLDDMISGVLTTYNSKFNQRGLFFYELCHCARRRLLLVFRKNMLESYLRRPANLEFLARYGYDASETLEVWLQRLKARLEESVDFPHEIGLFLGYPLADVEAFIQTKGEGYKLCGEWKVYSNVVSAKLSFHCFQACRDFCHNALLNGKQLESLIA